MLAWLTDPIVRLALRDTFGWGRVMLVVPFAAIAFDPWDLPATMGRMGLLALCMAGPVAAAHLIELERDGRLDQMRLAGRAPGAIAGTSLLAAAAPWLIAGVALTVAAAAMFDALNLGLFLRVAAMAGISAAVAASAAAVPLPQRRTDPRIVVVGLGMISLLMAVIGSSIVWRFESQPPLVAGAIGSIPRWTWWLLGNQALIIAGSVPFVMRRIERPPAASSLRSRSWIPRWSALLVAPGFYRGLMLGWSAIVVFGGLAFIVLFARWTLPAEAGALLSFPTRASTAITAIAPLLPIFAGVLTIALICREDAESGRLDLIRQSARPAAASAIEAIVGLWAPFVVASAAIAALVGLLFGESRLPNLLLLAVIVALIAPLPVIEGWRGDWPLTLTVPLVAAGLLMLRVGLVMGAALPLSVVWIAAPGTLRDPRRAPLSGWAGVAIVALLAVLSAAPFMNDTPAPFALSGRNLEIALFSFGLAAGLIGLAPFIVEPRSVRLVDRWGQPATIAVAALVAAVAGAPIVIVLQIVVVVLTTWFVIYRIQQWRPRRPILQAAARVALFAVLANLSAAELFGRPALFPLLTLALGVVVAAASALADRVVRRRRSAP